MTFSKRDILDSLGIETRTSWLSIALAGFGVGCVVGATMAILLAPKSGSELRAELASRGRHLVRRGRGDLNPTRDEQPAI